MRKFLAVLFLLCTLPFVSDACRKSELHIVTTGDVHGRFFSRDFVTGEPRNSLMSVKYYVDSLRAAVGEENVLLLDCGDILQGDNSSYYFNYVATEEAHVYPKMANYMGYDACTVGNHDSETGHPVYDRVRREMDQYGIPWLAGNALKDDGSSYFQEYCVVRKNGRKILIMGYNNANIDHWLVPELWEGMHHERLVPFVQQRVDLIKASVKPDAVIVLVHSGTGQGTGDSIENEGLDLFNSLHGVDVLVTAHDHSPALRQKPEMVMVNAGARCSNVGHAVLGFKGRKVVDRRAEIVRMNRFAVDTAMEEAFRPEWETIHEFTVRPIGELEMPIVTREAYTGMNAYLDFLHTVQLSTSGADVSLSAPLTFNGVVEKGAVLFGDLFTIYPYENMLYVLNLTGKEIKDLLEYSYDRWIVTPGDHVLNIRQRSDSRTGAERWSFANRSYNFDSAAGISYTVDVTQPFGSRVCISTLANGTPFDESATYEVAMTSYRATGGGSLLTEGAGIDHEELQARVVRKYPEIRQLIYGYFTDNKVVGPSLVMNRSILGEWKFIPESLTAPLLAADMALVF